jgi:siderophore synthetase component
MTHNDNGNPSHTHPDKWADRTELITLELSDAESAAFCARAAQRGLTPEEYIRTLLGLPP